MPSNLRHPFTNRAKAFAFIILFVLGTYSPAFSQTEGGKIGATLHFQQTLIMQANNNFPSPYSGQNSFLSKEPPALSVTSNFFLNVYLPDEFRVTFNPELSGGKALSGALGIAGFPNGDAFRIGKPTPQLSSGEYYLRKTLSLSGPNSANGGSRLTFVLGKFSIVDFFDHNAYSNDARTQFMNWALMNNGAWDYPADTRGYIPGFVAEFISPTYTLRFAATMQTNSANGPNFDPNIAKAHGFTLQGGYAYRLGHLPGKIRLLLYYNTGRFGSYTEAATNPIYDHNIVLTRQYGRTKVGFGVNIQQKLCRHVGLFARIGWDNGQSEAWSYTEIDRTVSVGILTEPDLFGRKYDTFGIGGAVDGLSNAHRAYLASGGYGFIIGDGKLPHYGLESVLETFYSFRVNKLLALSADYQFVINPAYNMDRGPIDVFGIRAHVSI